MTLDLLISQQLNVITNHSKINFLALADVVRTSLGPRGMDKMI